MTEKENIKLISKDNNELTGNFIKDNKKDIKIEENTIEIKHTENKSKFNWTTLCALFSAIAAGFSAYISYSNFSYLRDISRPLIDIQRTDVTHTFSRNKVDFNISFALYNVGKEPLKIVDCDWCILVVKGQQIITQNTQPINILSSGAHINFAPSFFIETDFPKLDEKYIQNNWETIVRNKFGKIIIAVKITYKSLVSNKIFNDKYYYIEEGQEHLEYLSRQDYEGNIQLLPEKFRQ